MTTDRRSYASGNFTLQVDGWNAGCLTKVSVVGANGGTARVLAAHELAHVVQQVALGKPRTLLRLEGARLKPAALARWIGSRPVVLLQLDQTGRTLARYPLGRLKPGRIIKTPSTVANEVAVESIELVHEGVTLD